MIGRVVPMSEGLDRGSLAPRIWRRPLLWLVAGTVLIPAAAHADHSVHVDLKGGTNLVSFQARFDKLDATPQTYYAGTLATSIDGGTSVDGYCVDLYDTTYVGGGGMNYRATEKLIQALAPPAPKIGGNGAGIGFLFDRYASTVSTDLERAALQIAIWKVDYDNGGSLNAGHFTMADTPSQHALVSQANTYLSSYHGTEFGAATLLEANSHPQYGNETLYQDLVVPSSGPGIPMNPVPEPRSFALVGLGIATVFALRWRRKHGAR